MTLVLTRWALQFWKPLYPIVQWTHLWYQQWPPKVSGGQLMTVTDDTIRLGRECIPGSPKHQMDKKIHSVGCGMQSCSQGSQLWLPMRKPRKTNRKSELPPQHCLFLWCKHSEWQRRSAMLSCKLAIFTACHMSFQAAVDILGEVIAHSGEGSPLGRIKLHRTKCSKLVTAVVAPALKEELREDIKGKKFAVLIDESTDVASHKLLCVVLHYFGEREGHILTEFLDLLQVVEATGEVLFNALKESLTNIGLSLVDCIGFGCDGASSMVGKHNSVWSRIKQESPNCLLVPCICHSLALSIAHAFDKLPSHLGHLLSEIPRWFSNSALRQDTFKTLFDIMDLNGEWAGTPTPFQKLSATRWFARGKVIFAILTNWEELKVYFFCTENAQTLNSDQCYRPRAIKDMLHDPTNFLYFTFVGPDGQRAWPALDQLEGPSLW